MAIHYFHCSYNLTVVSLHQLILQIHENPILGSYYKLLRCEFIFNVDYWASNQELVNCYAIVEVVDDYAPGWARFCDREEKSLVHSWAEAERGNTVVPELLF